MAEDPRMDAVVALRKTLEEAEPDVLRSMVKVVAEALMASEAQTACGAGYGEASLDRLNSRNGYRTRRWDTRAGSIELAIPKLRHGSYYPGWLLEPRRRGERALMQVVAEAYVKGISTRKVDDLVRTLGIEGMSKSQVSELAGHLDEELEAFRSRPLDDHVYPYVWMDAMAVKTREAGRVVSAVLVIATAVNEEGHREVLGVDTLTAEDGPGWTGFLRSLVARGLKGVQLVVSDAHEGLKKAIELTLPGASWQRCRTHFMRNLLTRVPRQQQTAVATVVRTIFAQPTPDEVRDQLGRVVKQLRKPFPKAAELLEDAKEDVLAFAAFPKAHWRAIWSNNPQERLNREVRRRTDVVGIFPNREALLRLSTAVLSEQHDEWQVQRRYFTLGTLLPLIHGDDETKEMALAVGA